MGGRRRDAVAGLLDGGRWRVLAVVAGGWVFVLSIRAVLPVLLPSLSAAFDIGPALTGTLVTLVWGGYAVSQFPAGLLIDRVGERRTLAASAFVGAVAAAGLALAPTFAVFVVAAAAYGLGTGLYAPPRVTVLARTFGDRSGAALGVTFAAGSLGAAAAPAVAGTLAVTAGWRVVLGLVVVPLAVTALLTRRVLPADTPDGDRTAVRAALSRLRGVATQRPMPRTWLAMTLALFVSQAVMAFLPTYLIQVKGFGQATAAWLFGGFFLGGALAQYLGGEVADRIGEPGVLAALSGGGALCLLALPVVESVAATAVLAGVLGSRLGIGSVGNGYVADILPAATRGTGYGLFRTVYLGVGATGSLVVGLFADHGLFTPAFLGLAGVTAVAALLFVGLPAAGTDAAQTGAAAPGDAGRETKS